MYRFFSRGGQNFPGKGGGGQKNGKKPKKILFWQVRGPPLALPVVRQWQCVTLRLCTKLLCLSLLRTKRNLDTTPFEPWQSHIPGHWNSHTGINIMFLILVVKKSPDNLNMIILYSHWKNLNVANASVSLF